MKVLVFVFHKGGHWCHVHYWFYGDDFVKREGGFLFLPWHSILLFWGIRGRDYQHKLTNQSKHTLIVPVSMYSCKVWSFCKHQY